MEKSIEEIQEDLKQLQVDITRSTTIYYRIKVSSYFEVISSLVALLISITAQFTTYSDYAPKDWSSRINLLFSSGWVFLSSISFFFECFCFLLTTRSLIVGLISSLNKFLRVSFFDGSEIDRLSQVPAGGATASRPTSNEMEDLFREYILRSQKAVDVAQRRPNVLLFVGTAIAILGLLFFIITLPSTIQYGFSGPTSDAGLGAASLYERLISITPRILMLLFIQVLAGFFLKQYRASMEEFRYYERVLRLREAQFMSYNLRKSLGDKKSLIRFSEILLHDDKIGLMKGGETTAVIQAHREEANEFNPLVDRVFSLRRLILKPKRVKKAGKTAA